MIVYNTEYELNFAPDSIKEYLAQDLRDFKELVGELRNCRFKDYLGYNFHLVQSRSDLRSIKVNKGFSILESAGVFNLCQYIDSRDYVDISQFDEGKVYFIPVHLVNKYIKESIINESYNGENNV